MQNKMYYNTIFCFCFMVLIHINCKVSAQEIPLTDPDGNIYRTVKIGNQEWMAENLRTSKFKDGTLIPLVTDNSSWSVLSSPGCCLYKNDTLFKMTFGFLYNGYAVNTGKLCPEGWHVSTDEDWTKLVEFLGGKNSAGGKMRNNEAGLWSKSNQKNRDESGFGALPGGSRYSNGLFFSVKSTGYWWAFTKSDNYNGWYRSINGATNEVNRNFDDLTNGFSVRCVKD